MDTPKFRKLEEVWDLVENEDKDLISAGFEKLLRPDREIFVSRPGTERLNDLFTFTTSNF
jgi:hypothetical protein